MEWACGEVADKMVVVAGVRFIQLSRTWNMLLPGMVAFMAAVVNRFALATVFLLVVMGYRPMDEDNHPGHGNRHKTYFNL
jgi:hypothetical protein